MILSDTLCRTQTRSNPVYEESDTTSSTWHVKDSDIEIRGEAFNRRQPGYRSRSTSLEPSVKPDSIKVTMPTSLRGRPTGVPLSNSSRGTPSQAQALQRLKEVKQARVNPSNSKMSSSDLDAPPPRKVVNYATLAKLESEQRHNHDSSTS